jgi:hypothetical protein
MLLFMAKAVVIETRICGPTVDPGAASALQGDRRVYAVARAPPAMPRHLKIRCADPSVLRPDRGPVPSLIRQRRTVLQCPLPGRASTDHRTALGSHWAPIEEDDQPATNYAAVAGQPSRRS